LSEGETILVKLTKKEEFIEETGMMYDNLGIGKTPGRIMGYLMVNDPPYSTLKGISKALDMAKSSISVALRLLTTTGFVERFTLPGRRADYYRIDHDYLKKGLTLKSKTMDTFRELIGDALDIIDDEQTEQREVLEEMYELYNWLPQKFIEIFQEWDLVWERRKNNHEDR
jgi:DNA-binding transcriptional regulator GbsR (MarR family)